MEKTKVSVIIPVYKPEKEVFDRLRGMLKKQTLKAEIIENWNMPEAKSMNAGVLKAKNEVVVILNQDCVPENEFWLERLVKPLEEKDIVATMSDLHLPEEYWKRYPFLTQIFTISNREDKKNGMDIRACAYRKKDILDIGLFNEDPRAIGFDVDTTMKLAPKGKIIRANVRVLHLHKSENFRDIIKKIYIYSKGNGNVIKRFGLKVGMAGFWIRIIKVLPLFGITCSIARFPFRKYAHLFPVYFFIAIPIIHIINLFGFWKSFFSK